MEYTTKQINQFKKHMTAFGWHRLVPITAKNGFIWYHSGSECWEYEQVLIEQYMEKGDVYVTPF